MTFMSIIKWIIIYLALVTFLFLIIGCEDVTVSTTSLPVQGCTSNSECVVGGCSSQLCVPKTQDDVGGGFFTTCEYREEYGCVKLTTCECIDQRCQWNPNQEYRSCLEQANQVPELR